MESLERVKTSMGILWCMRLKRKQTVRTNVEVLNVAWQIDDAHAKFTHCNKKQTRAIAKELDVMLSSGKMGIFVDCALAKTKQKKTRKSRKPS